MMATSPPGARPLVVKSTGSSTALGGPTTTLGYSLGLQRENPAAVVGPQHGCCFRLPSPSVPVFDPPILAAGPVRQACWGLVDSLRFLSVRLILRKPAQPVFLRGTDTWRGPSGSAATIVSNPTSRQCGRNVLISGSDAALSAVRSRQGRVIGHVVTCPIYRDLHEAADGLAGLSCRYTLSGRIFPFGSLVLPLLPTWLKTCFPRRTASVFLAHPGPFWGRPCPRPVFRAQ